MSTTAQIPPAVVIWIALQFSSAMRFVVDLPRVADLHQLPVSHARHGAERDDDILKSHRHRVFQNVLEQFSATASLRRSSLTSSCIVS